MGKELTGELSCPCDRSCYAKQIPFMRLNCSVGAEEKFQNAVSKVKINLSLKKLSKLLVVETTIGDIYR